MSPEARPARWPTVIGVSLACLLAMTVADWVALRSGKLAHPTWFVTVGATVSIVLAVAGLTHALSGIFRAKAPRLSSAAGVLIYGGIVVALSGGLVNWLGRLQGYVILYEGETAQLASSGRLQGFDRGPLANLDELRIALNLLEVELQAAAPGRYNPASSFVLVTGAGDHRRLRVAPGKPAAHRDLRFYQGAFGFAPRVVVTRDGKTVFDRVVPFLSERLGADGVTFNGEFEIERESLLVKGVVDISSLDRDMRGHPRLRAEVSRAGRMLGAGDLRPGHFADVGEGIRIGFADLKKWSEIDIARRSLPVPVYAGLAMIPIGALLHLARLFRRRR